MRRLLVLALGLAACVDEPPHLTEHTAASEVDDYLTTSCSTAVVLGLSQQIAEEVNCLEPGQLVAFVEQDNVVFQGPAVLPYLSTAGRTDLLAAAASLPGSELRINSAYRTVAQQYLLYEWFQRDRCGITAAAQPGSSNHESGRAIDVDNYTTWLSTLERHGWDQTVPGDEVHFDHLASPDLRGSDVEAFQRLWNRNHPEDTILVDGDWGPMTAAAMAMAPAEGFALGAECDEPDTRAVTVTARSGPLELATGTRATYSLTLANTGDVPWAAGTAVAVAGGMDAVLFDPATWVDAATLVVLDAAVAPGEDVEVLFELLAPSVTEPTALTDGFVLDDGGVRFGTIAVTVTVLPEGGPTEPEGDSGCSAGVGSGGGLALLLAIVGLRRRRRP